MALPSSRRPAAVEEERRIAAKIVPPFKVNIQLIIDTFMNQMTGWYETMSNAKRRKLTLKKLKNKAISVLYSYDYEYDRLPRDWVLQLAAVTEPPMQLYERKKRVKDFSFLRERGDIQLLIDPLRLMPNQKFPIGKTIEGIDGTRIYTALKNTSAAIRNSSDMDEDEEMEAERNAKPLMDLTKEPPPADWIEAYYNGEHRRRELTLVPGEEENILFYDYEPRYKELDPEVSGGLQVGVKSQPVHDADSFTWFTEHCVPEDNFVDSDYDIYT